MARKTCDRVASLSLTLSTAEPQSYSYDGAKRLSSLTSPAGTFSYSYFTGLGAGTWDSPLVKKLTLPSSAYITNTFDTNLARLTGTYLKHSSNTNLNYHTYEYNSGNQRTKQTRADASFVDYTYDPIGQLKTATGKESGGSPTRLQEKLGYVYDAAGNLQYRTNNAMVQTFNVNNLNELTTVTRSGTITAAGATTIAVTNATLAANGGAAQTATRYGDNTFAKDGFSLADGTNTFTAVAQDSAGRGDTNTSSVYLPATATLTYDLNGNLTSDGRRGFDYDDENQLIRITMTNAWKSEFTYDGRNRRRNRKEWAWQNSAWVKIEEVRYVYDGMLVIQERDGNNVPTVSYTRGRDLSGKLQRAGGIGGLLAMSRHSTPVATHSFYHADANGNVTCLINDKQVVVAKYLYDPYGNALASSGPMADVNLYRFSSKEVHAPSGLYYYGYRFYEPNLQRWVNRDPIGEQGGRNLFAFVTNDPLNLADSVGLCWEDLLRQAEQAVNASINDLIGGYPHANSPPVPVTSPLGQFFNQAFKDAMSTLQTLRDNAAGVNGIIPQATAMGASSAGFVFSSAGVETFGAGAVAAAGAGVVSAGLAGAGAGLLIGNYAPGPTGTGSLNQETTEGWVTILEWWYAP